MHRYRFILLIMLVVLLTSLTGTGWANDEKQFETAVTKGTYALENGESAEAVRLLQTAVELRPQDHAAHLLLGIALVRQGEDTAARSHLLTALRVKPDDARTLYELGISFVKLNEYTEARDFFSDVAELSTDPQLTQAANNYLTKLPTDEQKGQFKALINLGIQHDSNVILEPDNPVVKASNNSDWRELALVNVQYSFAPGKKTSGAVGYRFYQSFHNRLQEFNTQQHQLSLRGEYRFTPKAALIGLYRLPRTYVDGDLYSNFHTLGIGFKVNTNVRNQLEILYTHEWRKFFNTPIYSTNNDRSGGFNRLTVNDRFNWCKDGELIVGYTYERDSTDQSYWNYDAHQGSLTLARKIGAITVSAMALVQNRSYQENFPGFSNRRSDTMQEYSLSLGWKLSETWSASVSDVYTINDSDLSIFEYKRNIFGIFVRAQL